MARAIAHSPLVKTAWAGADPNWGRILAAVGNSGIPIDAARVNIYIGDQLVCLHGSSHAFDESRAHAHLARQECQVRVEVGRGRHGVRFWTTDLSAESGRRMTERILIVDDHPLTRDALAGLLAQNGFDVVGQAGSGEEAIARAGELRPALWYCSIHTI